MEGADIAGMATPRTIDGVRRHDLQMKHWAETVNLSPFGKKPRAGEWRMFRQGGFHGEGLGRWCVYPCDQSDPLWHSGIWFDTEQAALDCLTWKREHASKRPWPITRAVVRLWRWL